jgi:gamma-glutamyltranspeptidase/glutathione hydrolase
MPAPFACEKHPVTGRDGVVAANHPLAAAAGAEILAGGGNAVDAAVATLLALCVVEPMMVGVAGGGFTHIRAPDGRHVIVDAMGAAPGAAHPTIFEPASDEPPNHMEVRDRRNQRGPTAVATPGNLLGWARAHAAHGRLPFADLVEPAIRHAERGFTVSHYLAGAIRDCMADLAHDPEITATLLPSGDYPAPGTRLEQGAFADTLRVIQREGAAALHGGELGAALVARIAADEEAPGWLSLDDLRGYETAERPPVVATYRGYEVHGPPPPGSAGVAIAQMLNIVEGDDMAALGFGTPEMLHLLVEAQRIAFADRRAHSGDPAFVDVPVPRLISKEYGAACRARVRARGGPEPFHRDGPESAHTTHVTVADRDGWIVTATHTINQLFGARFMVPGTGIIPNNYMSNFDPHPGRALSIAPGKRVPTSMAPVIVTRAGRAVYALGMPGGLRIFGSVFQALVNLIDHRMSLQEAVEAPRIWTQGQEVEVEPGYAAAADALASRGHTLKSVPHVGGGMNGVAFGEDGTITGAACWRADGMAVALGGGLTRPGVRFWPDRAPEKG